MPYPGSVLYVRPAALGWECSEDDREWRVLPDTTGMTAVEAMELARTLFPGRMVAVISTPPQSCPPTGTG